MLWAFDRATGDPARPRQVWMSDFTGEREMHQIPVQHAFGHVVVAGLGMGLAAWELCQNPAVERVTALEQDPSVIELWNAHGIELPKLTILCRDALRTRHKHIGSVDLLYADIWLKWGQWSNVVDAQRMAWRMRPRQIYFWGQEHNIADCARKQGRPISVETCKGFASAFQMPLLGPELPDYPDFVRRAQACLDSRLATQYPRS